MYLYVIEQFETGDRKDWPNRDVVLEALHNRLPDAVRDVEKEPKQ